VRFGEREKEWKEIDGLRQENVMPCGYRYHAGHDDIIKSIFQKHF
jgi:hypothetical protein